jgi:gamma-butyrobetaine dioxygenase
MTKVPGLATAQIQGVEVGDEIVRLAWRDGHQSEFHFLWLRDNCTCVHCGNRAVGQKLTLLCELAEDCSAKNVLVEVDGSLGVEWLPDGHRSTYAATWLREHCYSETARRERRHNPVLWDAALQEALPETSYDTCFGDDAGLHYLLGLIRDRGFAIVHGVPGSREAFERMVRRVGYPRETNYGRMSDLVATQTPKTLSNTKHRIPLHTDEGYRHANPGMLAFQCLSNSADGGGATLLADGFKLAQHVREHQPQAFDVFSRVSIVARRFHVGEMDLRSASPVISVDYEGRVQGVRFNERSAAPLDVPTELVRPVYKALGVWQTLANDPAFQVQVLLKPGDFLIFDNQRVLHGRRSFAGHRHLLYAQLDLDEAHSRALVLAARLGETLNGALMHRGT